MNTKNTTSTTESEDKTNIQGLESLDRKYVGSRYSSVDFGTEQDRLRTDGSTTVLASTRPCYSSIDSCLPVLGWKFTPIGA
jgi:hypothetical protein